MQVVATGYYHVSIDEIKQKISKRNGKGNGNNRHHQTLLFDWKEGLDNVKKIINDFGEKITRIDGEIPIDLPIYDGDRFLFISYDQSI